LSIVAAILAVCKSFLNVEIINMRVILTAVFFVLLNIELYAAIEVFQFAARADSNANYLLFNAVMRPGMLRDISLLLKGRYRNP
jgi:hypothetical protein